MLKKIENENLILFLSGRIDSTNTEIFEKELGEIFAEDVEKNFIFDAENLEYISSAGLRSLLKFRKLIDKKIVIQNASAEIYEIFDVTGFDNFFDVQKKLREISVEGCKKIGSGVNSKVFQLDNDTIVKIYNKNFPREKISAEINISKKIFILGFPTAISYDIVKCGENFGLVFEKIGDSISVGNFVTNYPEKFLDAIKKMAELLKNIHATKIENPEDLPSLKERWKNYADNENMKNFYSAKEIKTLKKIVEKIPERLSLIHCDFHSGNALFQSGELMVIDVGDVGFGHPFFDFAQIIKNRKYILEILAKNPVFDSMKNDFIATFGMSEEKILSAYDNLIKFYFDFSDAETKKFFSDYEIFANFYKAFTPATSPNKPKDFIQYFVDSAREKLLSSDRKFINKVKKFSAYF